MLHNDMSPQPLSIAMKDLSIELTKRRTPRDLAKFSQEYKQWVSENDLQAGLLRMEKDYKFFIDEVWPLSNFCSVVLDESYEIEPIKGNQGYDARVYKSGVFQFNIEIAYPHDGQARAQNARRLVKNGVSPLKISSPSNLITTLKKIKDVCKKKSKKDYSDSVLLFNIATGAVNEAQVEEFLPAMQEVQKVVEKCSFKARSVYLYFSPFKKVVKVNA